MIWIKRACGLTLKLGYSGRRPTVQQRATPTSPAFLTLPVHVAMPVKAWRALAVSTSALAVCFMALVIFGVIGFPLRKAFSLDATEFGMLANDEVASVLEHADLVERTAVVETHGVLRVPVTDAQDRMDAFTQGLAKLSRVIRRGLRREASKLNGAAPTRPLPLRISSAGTAGWISVPK